MKRIIIEWLFKKPIRKYIYVKLANQHFDYKCYLYDLLYKDEVRMVGSKEGLQGYYDLDLEINRQLQTELKKHIDEGN